MGKQGIVAIVSWHVQRPGLTAVLAAETTRPPSPPTVYLADFHITTILRWAPP